MKTEYWIKDLKFSVEHFDERGDLKEVLGRLHDLDAARDLPSLPDQISEKNPVPMPGRAILRRSDRDADATCR